VSGVKQELIGRLVSHLMGPHRQTYEYSWWMFVYASTKTQEALPRLFTATVLGDPYPARQLSMRYVIYWLLHRAFHLNLFRKDLPTSVVLPFLIYDDATSQLTWPVYASLLGFVRDINIFGENHLDSEILQLFPWFIGLVPESKETCHHIDLVKSVELKEVVMRPFILQGHTFHLKFSLLCADHSRQWKNIQNKCGGHFKYVYFLSFSLLFFMDLYLLFLIILCVINVVCLLVIYNMLVCGGLHYNVNVPENHFGTVIKHCTFMMVLLHLELKVFPLFFMHLI